ncbi:hypothetical protein FGO68_gene15759 [Halteria grandinella]|uniref:Uncharacterized protein n=1 Tax=Halteria grandinella TaxID=5974 RepID=A0A8J8TA11_HALGN|nr:hypothetical protein FGO68_gene15759 [Halteria grandinella]
MKSQKAALSRDGQRASKLQNFTQSSHRPAEHIDLEKQFSKFEEISSNTVALKEQGRLKENNMRSDGEGNTVKSNNDLRLIDEYGPKRVEVALSKQYDLGMKGIAANEMNKNISSNITSELTIKNASFNPRYTKESNQPAVMPLNQHDYNLQENSNKPPLEQKPMIPPIWIISPTIIQRCSLPELTVPHN